MIAFHQRPICIFYKVFTLSDDWNGKSVARKKSEQRAQKIKWFGHFLFGFKLSLAAALKHDINGRPYHYCAVSLRGCQLTFQLINQQEFNPFYRRSTCQSLMNSTVFFSTRS